jgi:hypothetical protein
MSTLRTLWDAAGEARLIELAKNGLCTREIAALMGLPYPSVQWKRKQMRLAGRLSDGRTGPKGPRGPASDYDRAQHRQSLPRPARDDAEPADDAGGASQLGELRLRPASSLSAQERKLMRRLMGW